MSPTRRDVLKASAGVAAVGSLAGCLDVVGLADDGPDADGYVAFFAPHDWVEQVSGEMMTFENPVGTGRMGHGWSPDADITPDVASTDIFFYLDTEEFSWAQNIASNLERDYDDIVIVDLLDGLEPYLIPFGGDESGDRMPDPDDGPDYPVESLALDEFEVWDLRTHDQLGYWHVEHWHGPFPDVLVDNSVPIGVVLRDNRERVVPLGDGEPYRVDARIVDGDENIVDIEPDGQVVEFHGNELGEAGVIFEFYHDDELIYDTAEKPHELSVVEEITAEADFYDPHTWVDPVIVQEMVDTVAEELTTLDPENANRYRENATRYNERVAGVDQQFEDLVRDAELDVAVFAGHGSFQYVERRYDFELETPVGVSPDAQASRDDIIGLVEVIDEKGIDTVLYDPFESSAGEYPAIVESILEESSAEYAEPLTPTEGTTEEWDENGWGWVEQMEEINIPSLEQALNPGSVS